MRDVLSKIPGTTHVGKIGASRGKPQTGEAATYHFTPIQARSYSDIGIIHRHMANYEPLWRGSKQPSDPDDVLIDLLKVLPATERAELKRERDIFTHGYGVVDKNGNFIGIYRYGGTDHPFIYTQRQLHEIAAKWLDLGRRVVLNFSLTVNDDAGRTPPVTSNFNGPSFSAHPPQTVSDKEEQISRGRYNGALFADRVKSIQTRWQRLAPILARLESGEDFEQIMESVTDDEVEMLAIYFAPHLTLSEQDQQTDAKRGN